MALNRISKISEIPSGGMRVFDMDGRRIAVFNTEGTFHAIDDTCPHQGGPLSEGSVDDGCVTCPWHGAIFELATGKEQTSIAGEDDCHHILVMSDGELFVQIE